jgi:uncharacterized protein YecE (DUF72 family)
VSHKKPIEFPQRTLDLLDTAQIASEQIVERPDAVPGLHIGTSAFTAAGFSGSFYPSDLQPRDYLAYYATKFSTVEIDATFYHAPTRSTVAGWAAKTPENFLIAAKVPQQITHEKCLVDCDSEFSEFISTMDLLGDKLGPLLFQFPYFDKDAFATGDDFLDRLKPFLQKLPKGNRFAIEIRNKYWLNERFADLLREHAVALVLQDISYMPVPHMLKFDYITAPFTYVRLLGDRKEIEKQTKTWDKVIVDRTSELRGWVDMCQRTVKRGIDTHVYVNNHFAGHSPATVEQFKKLWDEQKE